MNWIKSKKNFFFLSTHTYPFLKENHKWKGVNVCFSFLKPNVQLNVSLCRLMEELPKPMIPQTLQGNDEADQKHFSLTDRFVLMNVHQIYSEMDETNASAPSEPLLRTRLHDELSKKQGFVQV